MTSILWARFKLLARRPGATILMTVLAMAFAYFLGGTNGGKESVPVYSHLSGASEKALLKELNQSDVFSFHLSSLKGIKKDVSAGESSIGLELYPDRYNVIVIGENVQKSLLDPFVQSVYAENSQKAAIAAANPAVGQKKIENVFQESKKHPVFTMNDTSMEGKLSVDNSDQLQAIFGFTLFFSIYTIAFSVFGLFNERQQGVWNRVILSPVSKTSIYLGHLIYSFVVGYAQIALVFSVFHFVAGVDFHTSLGFVLFLIAPYVFAIVAFSLLITSLVKTVHHFRALIPLLSVSMAMIGGAYWPIEIVSSNVMISLSKIVPITYGMDLLKGVTIHGYELQQSFYSVVILLLMGIIMMGISINIMERKQTA